jgi:hypothetical protein
MGNVLNLKSTNPLVGTWGSLDDDGTSVEYTISQTTSGLSVSAKDIYDGEFGTVSEIEQSGSALYFTVAWSTGRACKCTVRPASSNQVQFSFTYTEHEHLHRRTT